MRWLLTRGRFPYLLLLAVITAALGWHAAHVGVERNNESLNTRDAVQLAAYERFKATFGSDEDLLLAVAHPRLLEADGLSFIDALTRRIGGLDGVRQVYSLTNAKQLVAGDQGAEEAPLIAPPFDGGDVAARARAAIDRNPDVVGLLLSADRRTGGLLIEIDERRGDDDYRARLIDAVRATMAEHAAGGVSLHLTGIAVQKNDVTAFIERDQRVLLPLALVILATMLAAFFRRLAGVVLPLMVTGVSVIWTLGVYRLAGHDLNAITALLPPVIMVLSLAVSVHMLQGWFDAPLAADRGTRLLGIVRSLRFPCFFASLTTACGFASLLTSDMPAVRQFGLYAALGVSVAFVVGMTLVPVFLSFLGDPPPRGERAQHRVIRRVLHWTAETAVQRPWTVLAVFGLSAAIGLAGIPYIRNNTDLVRFLKAGAPLYRDTMFIDAHLTGANAFEFVVARTDGAALTTAADIQHLADFEAAVRRQPEVTGVISILAILRQVQRAEMAAHPEEAAQRGAVSKGGERLVLPDNDRDAAYAFDLLEAGQDQALVRRIIAPDFTRARLSVRIRAIGTGAAAPLAAAILSDAQRIFGDQYSVLPTGAFYHVVQDSNRLVDAQVRSFAVGLGLVFLAIGLLFRSAKLVVISLIPNVIPVAWTGGIMGAFGIDLSTGTAMIASAVIGLVVDDTIHYLTHYYRAYRGDAGAAVRHSSLAVGPTLVMNNLILVLGFWVGCFGSFKPTIYFSLLTGITMISAMVCDLFVTPACLVVFDRTGRGAQSMEGGAPRRRIGGVAEINPCVHTTLVAAALLWVALAGPAVAAATPSVVPRERGLVAAADDVVIRRVFVPSPDDRVGEVRVVRRGNVAVVQTLLYSKILRRVVGEIRKKEMTNWPDSTPGHADARRYVEALEQAQARIWDDMPKHERAADRRQKLLIELVLGDAPSVAVGRFEMEEKDGAVRVTAREVLALPPLSRDYVIRNARLIVADSFKISETAAQQLIGCATAVPRSP